MVVEGGLEYIDMRERTLLNAVNTRRSELSS